MLLGGVTGPQSLPSPLLGWTHYPEHNAITSIAFLAEISPPLPSAGTGEASGPS